MRKKTGKTHRVNKKVSSVTSKKHPNFNKSGEIKQKPKRKYVTKAVKVAMDKQLQEKQAEEQREKQLQELKRYIKSSSGDVKSVFDEIYLNTLGDLARNLDLYFSLLYFKTTIPDDTQSRLNGIYSKIGFLSGLMRLIDTTNNNLGDVLSNGDGDEVKSYIVALLENTIQTRLDLVKDLTKLFVDLS